MNPTNSNEVLPTSSTHPASGKGDMSNDSDDSDVSFDEDDDEAAAHNYKILLVNMYNNYFPENCPTQN